MSSVRSALDSTELAADAPPSPLVRTRHGQFVLEGAPVSLIAVGPVVLREISSDAAEQPLLDRLAELSSHAARFQIRIETWAFCWDRTALCPWIVTEGGFDLASFDERFWARAVEVARLAVERGVLVEFVLFDAATLRAGPQRTGWWRNPFNAACGGPVHARAAGRFFQADEARLAQEALARRAVSAFNGLTNITWELVASLDGADPMRLGFVSNMLRAIRAADSLDRLVTVSIDRPKRTESALYSLQGVDAVGFDWVDGGVSDLGFGDTVEMLRPYGKPVVNHRAVSVDGLGADADERFRLKAAFETSCSTIIRPTTIWPDTAEWFRKILAHGGEGKDA